MQVHTHCRLCDAHCGLIATVDGGRLSGLAGDPDCPLAAGHMCDVAEASVVARASDDRITRPMKRVNGVLEPTTWAEALPAIAKALVAIRKREGVESVGLHLGGEVERGSEALVRSLAFGVGMGTPAIYSAAQDELASRHLMTEWMLGQASHLLSDVGRAHYVILLGTRQEELGWGPGQAGTIFGKELRHSMRTKGTHVVAVDPSRTEGSPEGMQHLSIRPGTQAHFLLGLLVAVVEGKWVDRQYLRDYTTGYPELVELLAPWSVERCAEICGIDVAEMSGVALKFSRAAMAVVHPGHGAFRGHDGALAAWAWLTLHAVTANVLRPGGLYEHAGMVDLHPILTTVPSARAPKAPGAPQGLVRMQAPASALGPAIQGGTLRALISVAGNPLAGAAADLKGGLAGLDLLVCLARHEHETAKLADWILPITHPWEDDEALLHVSSQMSRHMIARTPSLVSPVGQAKPTSEILAELYKLIQPGLRGSAWGVHLGVVANQIARADLSTWRRRLFDWATEVDWDELEAAPHRVDRGEADRALWRVSMPGERVHLVPEVVAAALPSLGEPSGGGLRLQCSDPVDVAPDIWHRQSRVGPTVHLHPDHGLAAGSRVRISSASGAVEATVAVDATIRQDTVWMPSGPGSPVCQLAGAARDAISGVVQLDGIEVELAPVG